MKRIFLFLGAGLLLVALGLTGLWFADRDPPDAPVFPHGQMTIVRADGQKFTFEIEIARTEEEEHYGLMHRHHLADNAGMLFIYEPPAEVSMWMKDTPLPLDMLFVRADGTIEKIAANAVPFDVTPIPADETVKGVVELNAGTARRLGLNSGDRLVYPGFGGR